jgi:hypothetical protein
MFDSGGKWECCSNWSCQALTSIVVAANAVPLAHTNAKTCALQWPFMLLPEHAAAVICPLNMSELKSCRCSSVKEEGAVQYTANPSGAKY